MKQTFEIPEGCTRVTIEQQENQIIMDFDPKVRFKNGDIVCFDIISSYIGAYIDEKRYHFVVDESTYSFQYENRKLSSEKNHRHATELEKQQLFDALAKVGKKWNAEKKCVEELRWRAKRNEPYYTIDDYFEVCESEENNDCVDEKRYNCGNYFQTEQQAKDFAERIKQLPR